MKYIIIYKYFKLLIPLVFYSTYSLVAMQQSRLLFSVTCRFKKKDGDVPTCCNGAYFRLAKK